jgi:hypothetical protein
MPKTNSVMAIANTPSVRASIRALLSPPAAASLAVVFTKGRFRSDAQRFDE